MYLPHDVVLTRDEVSAVLRAIATLDIRPGPGGSRMSAGQLTDAAVRPLLGSLFPGGWKWATVVALYPSSQLVAHRDPPFLDGQRVHLPLQVNPDCWVFHDGTWQQLTVGQSYTMDPSLPHGAVNWGDQLRLHLLLDVEGLA